MSKKTSASPLADLLRRYPDTQYLDAFLCDLSCVMRGKRFPIEIADKVFSDGMMLPGSSVLLSVAGDSLDPEGMGFSDGDPDQVAVPIANTLAPSSATSHAQIPAAQVLLTLQDLDGVPYYFEPRNVLARVLERFAELGLTPVVAFELEFYLLDTDALQPPRAKQSARDGATQVYGIDQVDDFGDYLHEVAQVCAAQSINCGAMSAEYAPAQFEINLQHLDDPLAAADQCVLFRRAVQMVAKKHGMRGSFMAKPYPESAGSGLHIHISLKNAAGKNAFAGDGDFATPQCATPLLFNALGGLQKTLPESTAILAPNSNAYRRFVPDSYVPMQPNWGYENRSVALRIPKSLPPARRIEHRVAGADANPYLTLATVLAGIHHGISQSIPADPPATGNTGAPHPSMPFEITAALKKCRTSTVLNDYFGADYLRAYCSCKQKEYDAFVAANCDEADWYL